MPRIASSGKNRFGQDFPVHDFMLQTDIQLRITKMFGAPAKFSFDKLITQNKNLAPGDARKNVLGEKTSILRFWMNLCATTQNVQSPSSEKMFGRF